MAKTVRTNDADFERQNEAAVREAREAARIEPRANAVAYDSQMGLVLVELRSGFVFGFPPERVPGLERKTAKQLATVRISASGDGLHWDHLDVQASLTGLMRVALNLAEWAPRLLGEIRSPEKARASRANGLKGGRPRKAIKRTAIKKKSAQS